MLGFRSWSHPIRYTLTVNRSLCSAVRKGDEQKQSLDSVKGINKPLSAHQRKMILKSPGNIKLKVLGNGCGGGPTSLVLTSGHVQYLFNCGEGTQKLCQEYGVKMSGIQALFLTSPTWKNMGGLLGYLLSLQNTGKREFLLGGHGSIMKLFDMTRLFADLRPISVNKHDTLEFSDDLMKIEYVIIKRKDDSDGSGVEVNTDRISNNAMIGYICKPFQQSDKISLKRCVEFGVPPGALFNKIRQGQEVTLDDGRIVKPSDVFLPDSCGEMVIILECPSEEYIDSLLAAKQFLPYQVKEDDKERQGSGVIVHIIPKELYHSAKYQMFCNRFPPNTVHLPLCETNTHELSIQSYSTLYKLNMIHSEIFPQPPKPTEVGIAALTTFFIRPCHGLSDDASVKITPEKYINEAKSLPGFESVLSQVRKKVAKIKTDEKRVYPRLVFLGTGSAIPTNDRNVSGILVATKADSYLLLDCGEGTWSQMVRHYGLKRAKEILGKIQCVYVSHMHADHHLGLITIINERAKIVNQTSLCVVGPSTLATWLKDFASVFFLDDFNFINAKSLLGGDMTMLTQAETSICKETLSKLGVNRISTCEVHHCLNSYAIRVDTDSDYSIVYSGDTRPVDSLIQLGQGCDLLIHEATLQSGLEPEATVKCHSTTAEAIEVARLMNAKFTLLTHFSQRYTKMLNEEDAIFEGCCVGLAFDHMEVSPKHLKILPHLYPALKCLFAEHVKKHGDRTMSRNKADWIKYALEVQQRGHNRSKDKLKAFRAS